MSGPPNSAIGVAKQYTIAQIRQLQTHIPVKRTRAYQAAGTIRTAQNGITYNPTSVQLNDGRTFNCAAINTIGELR
jgi:hypothetical protein